MVAGSDPSHRWHVDPLDGTTNFLHGIPHFCISVGLEREGLLVAGVIYDPAKDEMFVAERGKGAFVNNRRLRVAERREMADAVAYCGLPHLGRPAHPRFLAELAGVMSACAGLRRMGAAALDMAYVAAGRADIYWERDIQTWDMAAGIVILRESGAFVSDCDGGSDPMRTLSMCCGNETLHREFLKLLKGRAADGRRSRLRARVALDRERARRQIGEMLRSSTIRDARPLSSPRIYLVRMAVFLILCGFLVLVLYRQLLTAFYGNPGLNSLILGVLAVGILLAIRQVFRLFREIGWVNHFSGAENRLARPPLLLAPVAALIGDPGTPSRLSVATMRSMLDSISARLDENRELVRYLAGLLVFLGLLGTFWGLIDTVNAVGRIIGSLRTGAEASILFDELKTALAAPLAGMGISFSASLFGLAGSLVLGFLDLQAGQAQNRFYTELEDWLAVATAEGSPDAVVPAVGSSNEVVAAINRLAAKLGQPGGGEASAEAIASLADELKAMVHHVRSEQQLVRTWIEAQATRDRELKSAIDRLAREREKVT